MKRKPSAEAKEVSFVESSKSRGKVPAKPVKKQRYKK